jgi:hypothetical protein
MLSTVAQLTERLGFSQQQSTAQAGSGSDVVDRAGTGTRTVIIKRSRKELSPMSKSLKKTLHVNHKSLRFLFNLSTDLIHLFFLNRMK